MQDIGPKKILIRVLVKKGCFWMLLCFVSFAKLCSLDTEVKIDVHLLDKLASNMSHVCSKCSNIRTRSD